MSAIVYNSPENMNPEVPVSWVKEGSGMLARNFGMYLSHSAASHPQKGSFHSHCHENTLKISYNFSIMKTSNTIERGTSHD